MAGNSQKTASQLSMRAAQPSQPKKQTKKRKRNIRKANEPVEEEAKYEEGERSDGSCSSADDRPNKLQRTGKSILGYYTVKKAATKKQRQKKQGRDGGEEDY